MTKFRNITTEIKKEISLIDNLNIETYRIISYMSLYYFLSI